MSLKDIKEFQGQLEQQGVDSKQPYIIDKITAEIKKDADKEIASITQGALLDVDMECEADIKRLIAERDLLKAALRESKEAEIAKNADYKNRITSFYGVGQMLASAILDSRAGRYVPMDWKIEQKLDVLESIS